MALDREAGPFDAHHRDRFPLKRAALPMATVLAACASHAAVHTVPPAQAGPIPGASRAAESRSAASLPAAAACLHPTPAACDSPFPAYVRDVLPILKRRCFGCHTGEGVAADEHDFSRIEALRGAGTEIVDEVSTCAMPPRARLGDDEANMLLRWVACGQRTD
jgi:hypothetical protein